jgi:hypothetical protein
MVMETAGAVEMSKLFDLQESFFLVINRGEAWESHGDLECGSMKLLCWIDLIKRKVTCNVMASCIAVSSSHQLISLFTQF